MSDMPEPDGADDAPDPAIGDWKRVRSVIEHENTLVNHRLTWLIVTQAGLLAFVGNLHQSARGLDSEARLLEIVAIVAGGILLPSWIYIQLNAAKKAMKNAADWWYARYGREDAGKKLPDKCHPPVQRGRLDVTDDIDAGSSRLIRYLRAPDQLPLLFVAIWGIWSIALILRWLFSVACRL
jgi:hypothetical protein